MATQKVFFPNAAGDQLAGLLEMPATGQPRASALFAHCFTCTKNSHAAARISRALAGAGFAVLRFDFTGLGDSQGDFGERGFSADVTDLLAAADFLGREMPAPALLIGHSLGGLAALYAAPEIASCVAVATLGSPATAAHVRRHLIGVPDKVAPDSRADVDIGGRSFALGQGFLDDLHEEPPSLADLGRALLVMHSPVDRIVGIDNASTLFQGARHPKSFVSLDHADHLLGEPADAEYAAGVIAAWASRYLPAATATQSSEDPVVVATTGSEGFRTAVNAGGHALTADEPVSVGGENTGPTPYGLLGTALAACTSMTLQTYARHKGIALNEATVEVRHSKIHADDCESCETTAGRIDRFERLIRLSGDLDDKQQQRMLEIADKCPVHRTLHGEVEITTSLGKNRA